MKIEISTEKSLTEELATLLQAHWLFCTSTTPIEHVYALDASRLFTPDITVFGARIQDELVGVGALRILDIEHAKSGQEIIISSPEKELMGTTVDLPWLERA